MLNCSHQFIRSFIVVLWLKFCSMCMISFFMPLFDFVNIEGSLYLSVRSFAYAHSVSILSDKNSFVRCSNSFMCNVKQNKYNTMIQKQSVFATFCFPKSLTVSFIYLSYFWKVKKTASIAVFQDNDFSVLYIVFMSFLWLTWSIPVDYFIFIKLSISKEFDQ